MNCSQVQEQTHKYHEDLLSEHSRGEVRAHALACGACKEYLLRQDHLSADLKRLYFSPSSYDLLPVFEAAVSLCRQEEKKSFWRKIIYAAALVFCALMVWQRSFLGNYFKPSRSQQPPTPARTLEPAAPAPEEPVKEEAVKALESLEGLSEQLKSLVPAEEPVPEISPEVSAKPEPMKKRIAYVDKACVGNQCSELKITDEEEL